MLSSASAFGSRGRPGAGRLPAARGCSLLHKKLAVIRGAMQWKSCERVLGPCETQEEVSGLEHVGDSWC